MCSLTSSMWCLRTSKAVCSSTPHGVSSVSAAHIPPPSLRTWSTCWTPCRPTPSQGVPWFQERGLWQDNSYEPRPGDIIFFDWDDEDEGQDGAADHVGIVEKVDGGIVYTVEGNSGDSCRENRYAIGHYEIYGYGTPTY
jgi:cell wall-associated NlpC family hydrolase